MDRRTKAERERNASRSHAERREIAAKLEGFNSFKDQLQAQWKQLVIARNEREGRSVGC